MYLYSIQRHSGRSSGYCHDITEITNIDNADIAPISVTRISNFRWRVSFDTASHRITGKPLVHVNGKPKDKSIPFLFDTPNDYGMKVACKLTEYAKLPVLGLELSARSFLNMVKVVEEYVVEEKEALTTEVWAIEASYTDLQEVASKIRCCFVVMEQEDWGHV